MQRLPSRGFVARLSLQASRSASMTPTWRPGLCWTVLSHLFDSRELAVEPRRILKRAAKRARCQARTSLCATYKCSRTGLAQGQAGEPHWTTRGRDALATGEEPPVLWKNHAAFIAILLQSGGGSEGKTGIQDGGLLCRVSARQRPSMCPTTVRNHVALFNT